MNHTTQPPMQRNAVISALPAQRAINPILASATRKHVVSTMFPTALSLAEAEQAGLYPGYYLRTGDGQNYWIGRTNVEARANLDRMCELALKDTFGWAYDIEYSFGQIVGGGSPWANLSAEHNFH